MSELSIVKFHTGLQLDYGLDAGHLSDRSSTAYTYLLSPNGLPLNVGWFDNSKKSLEGPNTFALTTHPEQPLNMHHRIILRQDTDNGGQTTLIEEDAGDYLEGYNNFPYTLREAQLQQPEIEKTIREFSLGAYVLTATTGELHTKFGWTNAYDVPAVREHGMEIISAGDVLAVVDNEALNRYAEIDPPILH